MRRKTYFTTVASYTKGSGAVSVTNGTKNVTVTGATFLTDDIQIGRRVKVSTSSQHYIIRTITGETTFTIDRDYDGETTTTGTYEIFPQEEYNLPIHAGHRMFMWHEDYGYPYKMIYITDQDFYGSYTRTIDKSVPLYYRMWGADMAIEQVKEPSVVTAVSSALSDITQNVTILGTVAGYPDFETFTVTGQTPVSGIKLFDSVESVVKDTSSVGRITVTANSGNTTVAVIPTGDTTKGITYKKIQLYPLPNRVFDMNVQYYKDPYRLVNNGDVSELGEDFDQAIIFLSVAILKYENNQNEGDKFLGMFAQELKTLRRVNMDKIDWFPNLKRPKDSVLSDAQVNRVLSYKQVGAYYGPRTQP
jgi:hypothetical protein